ncbi:hypothetical protein PR048_004590 [Dryococelus australis]|uniref:Uncharacterized protein n=1 Tax=Dryococelus australis TaxID=614101 RepID=A0ABQ9I5W9_9NEOP|nr:hypothetical protein PR048_004590 [Dryococelus australis]
MHNDAILIAVIARISCKTHPLGRPALQQRDDLVKGLKLLGVDGDWSRESLDRPRWRQLLKVARCIEGL